MNYKKSIMSLAAVMALSSSALADGSATYLPLNNVSNDRAWIMFGVNDFSNGVSSSTLATIDAFTNDFDVVTDDPTDDLATAGFKSSDGENMGSVQGILNPDGVPYFTQLKVGLKSSDLEFSQTSPVRSMYIAIEGTETVAKIKLTYKAALEGREVEVQVNGSGTILRTTISQNATFSAPAVARNVSPDSGDVPADLTKVDDVLCYDLTAAPIHPAAYSKTDHQFDATAGVAQGDERFYYYDAANRQWRIWDRSKTGTSANTITNFEKGKAYWGRLDLDSDSANNTNAVAARAGLVLGETGRNEADPSVYTGKLTEGWNMISFDPAAHPDFRNAATGIIVNAAALADNATVTLVDETGVNSITITIDTVNDGASEEQAAQINKDIETAKLLGTLPKTFNVKAFAADAEDTNLIFISDKKFTLKDDGDASFTTATSLAGGYLVNTATDALTDYSAGDIPPTGVTSVYGEFALVVEPLVGANTAAELDEDNSGGGSALSGKVQFGNIDGDSKNGSTAPTPLGLAANDTTTTVTTAAAVVVTDDVFDGTTSSGTVSEIDTDFDGTTDMLLMAADKPFYVKDNTYTRVYKVNTTTTGTDEASNANPAFKVSNTVSATIAAATVADDATAADIAGYINDVADDGTASTDTKTYAAADPADATKLVVVTADSRVFDLLDADSAVKDYFTKTTSQSDIAKGAVKRVINIADLAREHVIPNRQEVSFTADAGSGETESDVALDITVGGVAIEPAATAIAAETRTDATIITMLDSLVSKLNTALQAANAPAYASHNYVDGMNNITKAVITIEGYGITAVALNEADDTTLAATIADANSDAGELDVNGASITANLKDNAIYTPDYANYGPLYTLKQAGYEAKLIIRPSTNIAASPTTHWDHIDLTRESKDWMKDNEFNLFSVDNSAGYWAYLEPYTNPNEIAVSNVVYNPSFAHQFNPITDITTNVINGGQLTMEITGLDEATSNVKVITGGQEVQLVKTGDYFTALLTEYEASGLSADGGSDIAVAVRATNGIGEAYTDSAVTQIDYDKPAKPVVRFTSGNSVSFTSTSDDVVNYYVYKDYIPDNGASPIVSQLAAAEATDYNICYGNYGDSTNFKVIAIDSLGIIGGGSASNAKSFTFKNILKGANVIQNSYGETDTTVVYYNSSCELAESADKKGVELQALVEGTMRIAYVPMVGDIDETADVPTTAFYSVDGTSVVTVTALESYKANTFYIEYNGALYSGSFLTRAAADDSFDTPVALTEVVSKNQTLSATVVAPSEADLAEEAVDAAAE